MQVKSIYILLLGVSLLFGCLTEKNQTETDKYLLAERYQRLLVQDSIEVIDFDFSLDPDNQVAQLEKELGFNLCYNDAEFAVMLNDSTLLECYVELDDLYCDSNGTACNWVTNWEYEILMNHKGQCLLNNSIVRIDSVSSLLSNGGGNKKEHTEEGVSMFWDRRVPMDSLDKLLVSIKNGFIQHAEQVSLDTFNSTIKDLTPAQFDSLVFMSDYYLNVDITGRFVAKPPPPINHGMM